jgi:cytochrome c553
MDGQTGKVRWQYEADAQVQAGVVPTRSGIVFAGDVLGNLVALNGKNGSVLKRIDAKGALNSGLISYEIGGEQYVAAAIGGVSLTVPGITRPLRGGAPLRVSVFGLHGGDTPRVEKVDRLPLVGATPEEAGLSVYNLTCEGCHGDNAIGRDYPPLIRQSHILTDLKLLKDFLATVPPPMPKLYPGLLDGDDIKLLVAYFKTLKLPFQPGYTRPTSRGTAEWPAIYSVLTHPRCINCHPLSLNPPQQDYPRQANDRHPHLYGVIRGEDSMGPLYERCSSCHGDRNNAFTGAPGASGWELAPSTMAWESSPNVALTGNELCTLLKDKTRNGGRDLAALLDHVTTEPLVLWSFKPGTRLNGEAREPPPISHAEFVAKFTTWVNAGGPCPLQ